MLFFFGQALDLWYLHVYPAILFWLHTGFEHSNTLFCDLQHFLDETKKHYSAGLEPTDFSGNPEDAVVKINSWVEEQTQGTCHISLVLQQWSKQLLGFRGRRCSCFKMILTFAHYRSPGKIKELILKGVVDAATKLVLVNAIYFKGKWDKQFKEEDTTDAQFRINKVTLNKAGIHTRDRMKRSLYII